MRLSEIREGISEDPAFQRELQQFETEMKAKYGLSAFILTTGFHGEIRLNSLIVPKDRRKQGIGSAVMDELNRFADRHKKRVTLSPGAKDDYHGTTSTARLRKFYTRHGYVRNRGRNKDFRISDTMFRRQKD